jgi:putative FmdB family regulatory protein
VPTYEYLCDACEHRFELLQRMSDPAVRKCPKCRKLKVRRLISGGAGLIFKGSGFYITDYRNKRGGGSSPGGSGGASGEGAAGDSGASGKSGGDGKSSGTGASSDASATPPAAPSKGAAKSSSRPEGKPSGRSKGD